jgi:hypothetical protein
LLVNMHFHLCKQDWLDWLIFLWLVIPGKNSTYIKKLNIQGVYKPKLFGTAEINLLAFYFMTR